MRSPLKEKIQNAINKAVGDSFYYYDCNGNIDGALIVGGRRRSRKKKKKKQKDGQKKVKTPSLESIKTRLSPKGCRKGESLQDTSPLITDNDENRDENRENERNDESIDEHGELNDTGQNRADDVQTDVDDRHIDEMKNHYNEKQKADDVMVSEDNPIEHKEPSVKFENGDDNHNPDVTFVKEDPDGSEPQHPLQPLQTEETTAIKSEASPLIDKEQESSGKKIGKGKDSKFKDQQPGALCCTIL